VPAPVTVQRDQSLQSRQVGEQRRTGRRTDNGEGGLRDRLDQLGQRPGRQDRLFGVRLGDIEDRKTTMHDVNLSGFSRRFSGETETGPQTGLHRASARRAGSNGSTSLIEISVLKARTRASSFSISRVKTS